MWDHMIESAAAYFGYDETDTLLLKNGISTVICDGADWLSVFLISFFLGRTVDTVLYILLFSCLRRCTGGWHAKTIPGCLAVYDILYILWHFLTGMNFFRLYVWVCVYIFCLVYINACAPVIHPNHPMEDHEIIESRLRMKKVFFISSLLFLVFSLYACLLYRTITVIFVYNAISMELLRKAKGAD